MTPLVKRRVQEAMRQLPIAQGNNDGDHVEGWNLVESFDGTSY
jgi:hypothetical protein